MVGADLWSPVVVGVSFIQNIFIECKRFIISFVICFDTQRVVAGERSSSPTMQKFYHLKFVIKLKMIEVVDFLIGMC